MKTQYQSLTYTVTHAESTRIIIGSKLLDKIASFLTEYSHTAYVVLCDGLTEKLFLPKIIQSLTTLSIPTHVLRIEEGEKSKRLQTISRLVSSLLPLGLDRKSAIIALGGGVVGDIATTVSGLYFRGIDCIQIPTTLLSQVDSSLGGKGAIDVKEHKNTIGLIKQPKMVLIDTSLTKSLPQKQITSGMGEIVKYALAMDRKLFEKLEQSKNLNDELLDWIIKRCVTLKMNIVEKDPQDITGIRAVLNFGHTLGQAIELKTKLTHGEAVAIGMIFAIKLSERKNLLSRSDANHAIELIKKYGLPVTVSGLNNKDLLKNMQKDKKTVAKEFHFVLLTSLGNALTNQNVSEDEIKKVLPNVLL